MSDTKGSAIALLCGHESTRIIVIDIDSGKAKAAGQPISPEILKLCERSACVELTPNGRHYYFILPKLFEMPPSQTNMRWHGEPQSFIDLLAADKLCVMSPSSYEIAGKRVEYKILRGSMNSLNELPTELYQGIVYIPKSENPTEEMSDDMLELISKSLAALPTKPCATNYDIWKRIGLWIKSLIPGELGWNLWKEFSSRAPNYSQEGCIRFWRSCHPDGSIGYATILYYIKQHASEEIFKTILCMRDEIISGKQYEHAKYEFEANHFYCQETQDICEIREDGTLVHYAITNAQYTFAEHNTLDAKGQDVIFIPKWLKSKDKRLVNRIVSTPLETPKGCYNLFQGFAGAHAMGENLAGLERFKYLCSLLGSKDESYTKYIIQWFAKLVQKPAEIPRSCMIFIGEEGVGKDTVVDFIGRSIIGRSMYRIIQNAENELYDTHSTVMVNSFLHKLEEASAVDNRRHADELKTLITQTQKMINEKNVKKFSMDVYPHFVMTTNNESPVKISETDRRFFITWVSSEEMGKTEFWNETYSLFGDEGSVASIWKFLYEFDISDMPSLPPHTAYYDALKIEDADTVGDWLKTTEFTDLTTTEAYFLYKQWANDNQKPYPKNVISLGKTFAKLVQKCVLIKRILHKVSRYSTKGLTEVTTVT